MATYKYTLYKTAKSQTVDHFYQHRDRCFSHFNLSALASSKTENRI